MKTFLLWLLLMTFVIALFVGGAYHEHRRSCRIDSYAESFAWPCK